MFILNFSGINHSEIEGKLKQIPSDETHVKIEADSENQSEFARLCYTLPNLPPQIDQLTLDEDMLKQILDKPELSFCVKAKLRLNQLEKLIVLDSEGKENAYKDSQSITHLLGITKNYFKPDTQLLRSIELWPQWKVDRLLASIPDDQTELDFTEVDLTQLSLQPCKEKFFDALPDRITTIKLSNTNIHKLHYVDFDYFCQLLTKFNNIYFDFDEIRISLQDRDPHVLHSKILSLKNGTSNAQIHLIKNNDEVISYTPETFKEMIEKQDPHLVKLNSSAPNQSHTHSIFKPVQKLALADNYAILQLAGKIRQEISGFKQSCFGLNNLKKANKLQQAFDRALTQVTKNTTPDEFLDYKEDDQESIREALSYNRIGFFDKPKSLVRIETQARVLSV